MKEYKKKGFPKWLAIVLLITLSYIALAVLLNFIQTLLIIYYGSSEPFYNLGLIMGGIFVGYLVYLGFKKLIKIIKEKKI